MIRFKTSFYAPIALAICIGIAFSSCTNTSSTDSLPRQSQFKAPVVQPLKFSGIKKIDWSAIKPVIVKPLVKTFDLSKLPSGSYDTAGLKPFKYPVAETRLDMNSLPQKDLDIDKLPSKPLKFKTTYLASPRLLKAGAPHLKNAVLSLFELGENQGLAGTVISCLFNDRDGFLWIASDQGLYRYDGENLIQFLPSDNNQLIFSMVQDDLGQIWMSLFNGGGVAVLDPKEMTLKKAEKGLSDNNTSRIILDEQQRVWVSTFSKGINIVDPKTQTVKWLDKPHGLSDTGSFSLTQDKNHNIWIASGKGINIIDLDAKKIKYLDKTHGLNSDSVDHVMFDRKGNLWVGLKGGIINKLDFEKSSIKTIKELQQPKATIFSILQDSRDKIWVGEINKQLGLIDPENRLVQKLTADNGLNSNQIINVTQDTRGQVWIATANGLNMMSNNKAVVDRIGKTKTTSMLEDNRGLVWQGSFFSGIDILNRKTKQFRHLGVGQGLANDSIQNIRELNDQIFIVSNGGLDIIDSTMHNMTHLGKEQGLSSNQVIGVAVDKTGHIWISERTKGLDVYDPRTKTIKNINKYLGDNNFQDMNQDINGRIWATTNNAGVDVIDPINGTIQYLNNAAGLKDRGTKMLMPHSNGDMWIGTTKGIYIADLDSKTLTSFSTPQGLINDAVINLFEHKNLVYAGTNKGVTAITLPATRSNAITPWAVESFGKSYGLTKVNVGYYITDLITKDGLYWWGDDGITELDFSKKDTYTPQAFITGMNIMDRPKIFTGRSHTISKGIIWDKVNGPNNTPVNLQLPYNQNYVQFQYANLDLAAHDTSWYRYRLVGVDTGWSDKTTAAVSRNYFNLSSGKYTFEVITGNQEHGWSKPATLTFLVTPPWWQTWWAYLIYSLLFFFTIWGFVTYRSYQLVKEKRELEHKVHIRTEEVLQQKEEIMTQRDSLEKAFGELKIAQNQLIQSEKMASLGELTAGIAHEIQNPLNFVNNFSEVNTELIDEMQQEIDKGNFIEVKAIAADIKENQEKISQHGKRADFIVKGMLQHSRTNTGEKQLTNLNLLADEFLKLSYHGLRAKDKSFNSEMVTNFDPGLPKVNVVAQDMGRVLLNLFNNAFYAVSVKKHTAGAAYKPEVTVTTITEKSQIAIKVKDNGNGIPDAIKDKIMQPFFTTKPTGEGTGLGLSLTYDMVVKGHGGSININSKEGEGSEFIIHLPINS